MIFVFAVFSNKLMQLNMLIMRHSRLSMWSQHCIPGSSVWHARQNKRYLPNERLYYSQSLLAKNSPDKRKMYTILNLISIAKKIDVTKLATPLTDYHLTTTSGSQRHCVHTRSQEPCQPSNVYISNMTSTNNNIKPTTWKTKVYKHWVWNVPRLVRLEISSSLAASHGIKAIIQRIWWMGTK